MSEWTVETLKEFVEQRFTDSDKAIQAALASAEKAVGKAETASEKRFDSVNEFRAQLSDQAATLMTRTEYITNHKALEDKIGDLTDRMNRSDGSNAGSEVTIGKIYAAIGAVGVVLGIIVLLANHAFR